MSVSNIVQFVGGEHENPSKNLVEFIEHAKVNLSIYAWDDDVWRIQKGKKQGEKGIALVFGKLGATAYTFEPFDSTFMDFAKAYIREVESLQSATSRHIDVTALRYLSAALEDTTGSQDVTQVSGTVIEKTAQLVDASDNSGLRKYQIGGKLEKIFNFLRSESYICPGLPGFQGKNYWKKPKAHAISTDQTGKQHRENRMPSMHVIRQIIYAFRLASTREDRYWSSVLILLLFAPNRAGEFEFLSVDGLGWGDYVDETGEVARKMFVQWFSEKGQGHNKKWVLKWFEEVVPEAFSRLIEISEPARKAAKFAYDNPGVYMIHEDCVTPSNYPQTSVLSDHAFASARSSFKVAKLAEKRGRLSGEVRERLFANGYGRFRECNPTYEQLAFQTLEIYKTAAWPKHHADCDFPVWKNLLLVRENEFHQDFAVKPFSWLVPDINRINDQLGARPDQFKSLFERLGLKDENGGPIKLESHDLRRWHNTHAMQEGATELEIAWASGRKDLNQNRNYDCRGPEAIAERLHEIVLQANANGIARDMIPIHERVEMNIPIHRSDLVKGEVGHNTVHMGPMGGCVKSISEPDCLKSRQCHACSKHVIVKGVPGCIDYFVEEERRLQTQWDKLQDRRDDPMMNRTVMKVGTDLGFVRGRRKILEDPEVPEGTVIRIPKDMDPSEVRLGLQEKGLDQPTKLKAMGANKELERLLPELFDDA